MILTGETEVLGENPCPSVTLSTANLNWTDRMLNPALLGERPVTKPQSEGIAPFQSYFLF
jgi:hypothetical protein